MSEIEPVPIYVTHVDLGSDWIARPYVQATNRVLQVLREISLPSFPGNPQLISTIDAIDYIIKHLTDSGAWSRLHKDVQRPRIQLEIDYCEFILKLFNQLRPLTPNEVGYLEPIMNQICYLCYRGVVEVFSYHKNNGHEMLIPKEYDDRDLEVYLREFALC
jgi:hypothetical protein